MDIGFEEAFQLRVYSASVDSDHKTVFNSARLRRGYNLLLAQAVRRKQKLPSYPRTPLRNILNSY